MSTHRTAKLSFVVDQQAIQAMSLSPSQKFVALACKDVVRIIKIHSDSMFFLHKSPLDLKKKGNFSLNDVSWSSDSVNVAVSTSTGSIIVLNVKDTRVVWDSGDTTQSLNKICWHPSEQNILASTGQDGSIKIWPLSAKGPQVCFSYHEPCKAVCFEYHYPYRIAAVYENGNLNIWDMRKEKSPLHKINAHIETGLSVAWHPHLPNTLATGSRDKTVKIWSLSNPQATVFHPSATLHTSSSVSQVAWRPIDGATDKKLQLATSSTNSPDVCLWTLGSPNYPACVLGGLSNPCAGFAWLDTPSAQVEEVRARISRTIDWFASLQSSV